jgi:hypothetical protein
VQRCECDYVVHSSLQVDLDREHCRHYDEDRKDFVFDGEPEFVAGGGEQGVASVGEDANVANGAEAARQAS